VLHSWGQNLQFHPHLHCVVSGGGLSPDGQRWISCRPNFFLPVRVLSELFRRLFLESLQKAFDSGKLRLVGRLNSLGNPVTFAQHCADLKQQKWVVYAKRPFAGPWETVIGRKSSTIVAACLACTRPTRTPWSQSRRTIETDMRISRAVRCGNARNACVVAWCSSRFCPRCTLLRRSSTLHDLAVRHFEPETRWAGLRVRRRSIAQEKRGMGLWSVTARRRRSNPILRCLAPARVATFRPSGRIRLRKSTSLFALLQQRG
jgi:hypothetical protein